MRPRPHRLLVLTVLALLAAVVAAPVATAAPPATDVTGTWNVTSMGSIHFTETYTMTSDGTVTGVGGSQDFPVHGHVDGSTFTYTDGPYAGSYTSNVTATLSPDGTSYSGSFHDSNGTTGSITATRATAPPGGGGTGTTGQAAAMQVNCDRDVATQAFTCTAQVADASGASPARTPTGSVTFALKPGGEGVFPAGATCPLQASQTGGASAFCSVRYAEGAHHIPTGSQPNLTATYSGDATFASATAEPKNEYVPPPDALAPQPAPDPSAAAVAAILGCTTAWTADCTRQFGSPTALIACLGLIEGCRGAQVGDGRVIDLSGGDIPATLVSAVDCDGTATGAVARSADSPTSAEDLLRKAGTWCDVDAAISSDDPDVRAAAVEALKWDLNARQFRSEVDQARSDITQTLLRSCPVAGDANACQVKAALANTMTAVIDGVFDTALSRVGERPDRGQVEAPADRLCGPFAAGESRDGCVEMVNNCVTAMNQSLTTLRARQAELGLTAPKPAIPKAKGSRVVGRAAKATKGRAKIKTIALGFGHVEVRQGAKGRLKIKLPAQARALLRTLRHRGVRRVTLRITVTTRFVPGVERTRTRKVALKLHR